MSRETIHTAQVFLRFTAMVTLCAAALMAGAVHAQAPVPEAIPAVLPDPVKATLNTKRAGLDGQRMALAQKVAAHNARCRNVPPENTVLTVDCAAAQQNLNSEVQAYRQSVQTFNNDVVAAERRYFINSMNALAGRIGWYSAKEQARLAKALESLDADGDPNATAPQIRLAWQNVLSRGHDEELARKAAAGDGPGFPGAGKQSFEDCTIFALANATGVPYSVVAARATELIRSGEWRDAVARTNPQRAIEQRGLNGGEVVMLAEVLGQAEVVRSADFAKTLREGRRLMLNVVPRDGDTRKGHAVVLTKAFQHGGETWYEMMDSNQGPQQRRYLSHKELNTMLQETGVAFRPEPGRTPMLLR